MERTKKKAKLKKSTIVFIVLDLLAIAGFIITYGPWPTLRNLYVNTAMNTMDHQYLARIFYSEEKISEIMNSNYFVTIDEDVNLDDIVIDTSIKTNFKDEYEKELLTRDNEDDLYKLINLKVGNANAYLVAIYDPTKVHLISKETLGTEHGERIITMCERYGGSVCINGGGFVDYGYGSGIPIGSVIENGEIKWADGDINTTTNNIIGMTKDGKLKLMSNATAAEALEAGVTDGMVFGPFLIVNGKPLEIVGDPWGRSPRVAIAQRKDGVMMFLVIDGENYINGASLSDVVETLQRYGAYNAANLDGGTSSTLIINNKLINNPPKAKATNGRYVVTGWGLIP